MIPQAKDAMLVQRFINLKKTHAEVGLDRRDLQYLDAFPIHPKRPALTFRGVSIE